MRKSTYSEITYLTVFDSWIEHLVGASDIDQPLLDLAKNENLRNKVWVDFAPSYIDLQWRIHPYPAGFILGNFASEGHSSFLGFKVKGR